MNCEYFRECMDNFENLSDEIKLEMTEHSVECESCRSELDFMLSIIETAKSLPKIEPPLDFMEKLNIRIDTEEEKRRNLSVRIFTNIRSNWKHYAATAACFAIVAVVISNGKMFTDKMNGNYDGIIQEKTVVTGDVSKPVSNEPADNGEITPVDTETDNTKKALFGDIEVPSLNGLDIFKGTEDKKTDSATEKKSVDTKTNDEVLNSNKVVNNSKSATAKPIKPSPDNADRTQENSAKKTDDKKNDIVVTSEPKESEGSNHDNITSANLTNEKENDINSELRNEYDLPENEKVPAIKDDGHDVENDYSLATGDKIALGRYQKIDKDGNPVEDEKKPVGSIKISSEDKDEAMSVILQYSADVDGDFYIISSEKLSMMLSCLIDQGINYSNYTPTYEGDITFKLVIS